MHPKLDAPTRQGVSNACPIAVVNNVCIEGGWGYHAFLRLLIHPEKRTISIQCTEALSFVVLFGVIMFHLIEY